MSHALTSPAHLKAQAFKVIDTPPLQGALEALVYDKGYDTATVIALAQRGQFSRLITSLFSNGKTQFGNTNSQDRHEGVLDYFAERLEPGLRGDKIPCYTGLPHQNSQIDRVAILGNNQFSFVGEGASTNMTLPELSLHGAERDTPICIIGGGAAGLMMAYALDKLGFHDVTLYEKRDQAGGIWSLPNVNGGSRNNPRKITFNRNFELGSAPGTGREVTHFLEHVRSRTDAHFVHETVVSVRPGDLHHEVFLKGEQKPKIYPIVINAIGLGKPKPISDPKRMTGPKKRIQAVRWQQILDNDKVEGKNFVFIGLGNSTAEMIHQLHEMQDDGIQVDYRILTHYPAEAVHNPNHSVEKDGRSFRVFRDLTAPNLVDYQGDLDQSRNDYFRALYNGKILTDIHEWDLAGKKLVALDDENVHEMKCDHLYILTGYQHPKEVHDSMGCLYDEEEHFAHHDYDGEMQRSIGAEGRDRVYPGYFGFGAILDAPHNRNSLVIPGMLFRMPDTLFGVILRATEYARKK